jgi:O-antigen ligase
MTAGISAKLQNPLAAATIGTGAAAIALAPGIPSKAALIAPVLVAIMIGWIATKPERGLQLFLAAVILTPPLPFFAGDSGAHLAPFAALLLLIAGALRLRDWHSGPSALPILMLAFAALLAGSSGLALIYSGPSVAMGSLARALLFAISVWIFLYTRAAPFSPGWNPSSPARWIFAIAVAAAVFACIDFYAQLPTPAGFGQQFVWVGREHFRRAQGLFYEANVLGNFCAFGLTIIPAALLVRAESRPLPLGVLGFGSIPVAAALILSYSRASLLNVVAVTIAFLFLWRGRTSVRALRTPALILSGTAVVGILVFPSFFDYYLTRLGVAFRFFFESPDRILSGRLAHWSTVAGFLADRPWLAVFGIGYKTLPYTNYVPDGVIADNTWLSMLAENGVVGVALFVMLNAAILRTALRAARSPNGRAAFFGSWIFCFWCGELMQMMSGDIMTYWRVLPVYFCTLALAERESEPADARAADRERYKEAGA